ncbi:MAG: histidyl-tRNA synthetase [Frankiales bacterium]|nr:histidyl-tRNA synthetase [Frankiales bacterium]
MAQFQAPKGTFDLVPPRSELFLAVRDALAAPVRLAGYGYVETPAFEETALFARGVGESTDIVSKEMYSFTTKGGDEVTLRPEGTAGVLRAVLENSLDRQGLPVKLWYSGSFYRYEKPQAGRYRHFSQVGAEVLGTEDPMVDAELVLLAIEGYRSLGLQRFRTLINSLGCRECRPAYRALLQEFLRGLELDPETRARIEINPLRVLDDKREDVQAQLAGAPLMADHLCEACRAHHAVVRDLLDEAGVVYEDTPTLVRGLDYYTRTTFEFVHDGLGSQSAIGGGGRYDGLAEELGGPELPGVGWALGVDRTVLAMDAEELGGAAVHACQVYVVPLGDQAARHAFALVGRLRRAGIATDMSYGGRGIKGAMKSADRSGAEAAIVIGDRDLDAGVAQLKWLESGEQVAVPLNEIVQTLKEKLA